MKNPASQSALVGIVNKEIDALMGVDFWVRQASQLSLASSNYLAVILIGWLCKVAKVILATNLLKLSMTYIKIGVLICIGTKYEKDIRPKKGFSC